MRVDARSWRSRWLQVALIAAIIVLRRPDALLHPQFWAEDGSVFFRDAYMSGLRALFWPDGGYFSTSSRLLAALGTCLPLKLVPAFFAWTAFLGQMLPVALLLGGRLDKAIPHAPARLALALAYALEPNPYELNINLTNLQWHLGLAAFLMVLAGPARGLWVRVGEALFLLFTSLCGPFTIFLLPQAGWAFLRARRLERLLPVLALGAGAVVQLGSIALHGHATRNLPDLQPSLLVLAAMLTNQLFIGGLVGRHLVEALLALQAVRTGLFFLLIAAGGCWLMVRAAVTGGAALRWGLLWTGLMLMAALIEPLVLTWPMLANPFMGLRYFTYPTLAWVGVLLTLLGDESRLLRGLSALLLGLFLVGSYAEFRWPAFYQSGFTAAAAGFAKAPPGTRAVFPENPEGWEMVLVKH